MQERNATHVFSVAALVVGACFGCAGRQERAQTLVPAAGISDEQAVVNEAVVVVRTMHKKFRNFERLAARSYGVLIVTKIVKGALIFGGGSARGVLLARNRDATWTAPAFYEMSLGDMGIQAGRALHGTLASRQPSSRTSGRSSSRRWMRHRSTASKSPKIWKA